MSIDRDGWEAEADCKVTVIGFTATAEEYAAIKERAAKNGATSVIARLDEAGNIALELHMPAKKFKRIRRITGYLVGTLDHFNNAKRAEERDRVKHGMGDMA